jgi:hypothetical protein
MKPGLFLVVSALAIPLQVAVFIIIYKLRRPPRLIEYLFLIALPLAMGCGAGLLPYLIFNNRSGLSWEVFPIIVALIVITLIMQSFSSAVLLKRAVAGGIKRRNIIGGIILELTPILMVLGSVVVYYTKFILPTLFAICLCIAGGVYLSLKPEPEVDVPSGTDKSDRSVD